MTISVTITMIILSIMVSSLFIGIYYDVKRLLKEKKELKEQYNHMNTFSYSYESIK